MTNNKQQTAFNWYIEQHNIIVRLGDNISVEERFQRFWDIIEQAKEMEKEQIIKARYSLSKSTSILKSSEDLDEAINYYNKTYGGNK
jgi:hypothetical protein